MRFGYRLPSGANMSKRQRPPTRTSISCVVVVNPFGQNHAVRCSFSVHALKTSERGALKTRERTISRSRAHDASAFPAMTLLLLRGVLGLVFLFPYEFLQVVVELVEALLPR